MNNLGDELRINWVSALQTFEVKKCGISIFILYARQNKVQFQI